MDVNYHDTLIAVADDCPVAAGMVPPERGGKKTLALIQYELLQDHPYELTSEEILFQSHMRHKGISATDLKARRRELWESFFAKPQPCLRASGLPKKYGWGLHCDDQGRVALCAVESPAYRRLASGKSNRVVKALRSSR